MNRIAYVGLGSNAGNPQRQLESAIAALAQVAMTRVVAQSGWYKTAPWGDTFQPDFINGVARIETGLSAADLLTELQGIELAQKRDRSRRRWGPRTLDLDLLLFGEETIRTESLSVPHPLMHKRAFVLVPLLELVEDIEIPGQGRAVEALAALSAEERSGVRSLKSTPPEQG